MVKQKCPKCGKATLPAKQLVNKMEKEFDKINNKLIDLGEKDKWEEQEDFVSKMIDLDYEVRKLREKFSKTKILNAEEKDRYERLIALSEEIDGVLLDYPDGCFY